MSNISTIRIIETFDIHTYRELSISVIDEF